MSYVVDENEYDDEDEELEEEEEDELEEEEEEEQETIQYAKPAKATKKAVAVESKKRSSKGKNKDPNRPRRNQSAFFLYCNEHRARVKANNPNIAFGDVARLLSEEFKSLDFSERSKWDALAEKDKKRYEKALAGYIVPPEYAEEDGGGKKKKSKKEKDPNKPKRNQSAFFIYSNAVRSEVKTRHPDASFGDLAKLISGQFKALAPKDRAKWDKLAEDDKARYQRENADYQG